MSEPCTYFGDSGAMGGTPHEIAERNIANRERVVEARERNVAVRERQAEQREFATEASHAAQIAAIAVCSLISLVIGTVLGACSW